MREINGFFDELFFTECDYGPPRLQGRTLTVPVKQLLLHGGHPLAGEGHDFLEGELVFDGVVESRRKLVDYIGSRYDPEGFRPEREEVDMLPGPGQPSEGLHTFEMEGIMESPVAWVDWTVRARSFLLRVR